MVPDFGFITFVSSDPLFSIFITLYTLILLYFPRCFVNLLFSPIAVTTFLVFSTLLRLGSNQTQQVVSETESDSEPEKGCHFTGAIDEWNRNVRAPLQVIYEEVEADEEISSSNKNKAFGTDELISLSLCYPESDDSDYSSSGDSDSWSDNDFPRTKQKRCDSPKDRLCFRWEDDRENLIEINLESKRCFDFPIEEENFIEIDIYSTGAPVDI